jgi:hypothetical protein
MGRFRALKKMEDQACGDYLLSMVTARCGDPGAGGHVAVSDRATKRGVALVAREQRHERQ